MADGAHRARRRPMNIQRRRLPEEHLPINYWSCGSSPSLHRAEMRVIPLAPSPWPPAPHQPLCNERRLAATAGGIDGTGRHRGLCPVINSRFNYALREQRGSKRGLITRVPPPPPPGSPPLREAVTPATGRPLATQGTAAATRPGPAAAPQPRGRSPPPARLPQLPCSLTGRGRAASLSPTRPEP